MKKFKSLLMAFAGVTAATLPIVAASCGNSGYIEKKDRVGVVTTDNKVTYEALQTAANKNKDKKLLSVKVVTDTGFVTDRSFNQSSWEGALTLADQIQEINDKAKKAAQEAGKEFTPIELDYSKLEPGKGGANENTLKTLVASGTNVFILSGFTWQSPLASFLSDKNNVNTLNENNITLIGVDFALSEKQANGFKNFIGLTYNAGQAAYVVGQSVAELYTTQSDITNKKVAAFGGLDIPPVDTFIIGYLQGILNYNTTNSKKDVQVAVPSGTHKVNLGATFQPDQTMQGVVNETINLGSSSIMPVAGVATSMLIDALVSGNYPQTVIGVDTNQANAFPTQAGRFISSVTKNITQSVYDTLLYVVLGINDKGIYTNNADGKPVNISGTLQMDWVGASQSTLSNTTHKDAMNASIAKYTKAFKEGNQEDLAYIGSFKATKDGQAYSEGSGTIAKLVDLINGTNYSEQKTPSTDVPATNNTQK